MKASRVGYLQWIEPSAVQAREIVHHGRVLGRELGEKCGGSGADRVLRRSRQIAWEVEPGRGHWRSSSSGTLSRAPAGDGGSAEATIRPADKGGRAEAATRNPTRTARGRSEEISARQIPQMVEARAPTKSHRPEPSSSAAAGRRRCAPWPWSFHRDQPACSLRVVRSIGRN